MRENVIISGTIMAGRNTAITAARYCALCKEVLPPSDAVLTLYDPVRKDPVRFCSWSCLAKYVAKQED